MDLILDPENVHVHFDTLAQAAKVLDLKVSVELVGVGAAGEKEAPQRGVILGRVWHTPTVVSSSGLIDELYLHPPAGFVPSTSSIIGIAFVAMPIIPST